MEESFFSEESVFLVDPFRHISKLVIEKETNENIFMETFSILLEYFEDKKEHRTISDLDHVMKIISDTITRKYPEYGLSSEEEKEKLSQHFIESFSNYFEKNESKLNKVIEDENLEPFLPHWIMNLETSVEIFRESYDQFLAKKHRVSRSSTRAVDALFHRLFELIKAIFLVLYRIAEQIYVILNEVDLNIENEIDYLLNDIVYLENIQRQIDSSFN